MIRCNFKLLQIICLLVLFFDSCKINDIQTIPKFPDCGSNLVSGYTDKTSYFPGDEIEVFLQSTTGLECGLGFFDINGSQVFRTNIPLFTQAISSNEPSKNGYNFKLNARIKLPISLASGIYSIENQIQFVVKSLGPADVTIVYPENTLNAYNNSGGKSLYSFNSTNRIPSPFVSFLRPMNSPDQRGYCDECVKWFPRLAGIQIKYITDMDLEDYFSIKSKILVIIGHSEYWTRKARNNFDQHINEGGHAVILSGNTMWWQVRYSAIKDALICYKNARLDPESDPSLKTILWVDTTLHYSILSSIGADFDHGGYGLKNDNGWDGFKIYNPSSPLLEGLAFQKGNILSLPTGEYDGAPIKGLDVDGFPVLDNDKLKFEKFELIGFDRGSRGGSETFATFIIFQKTKTSGIIINTGSNSWCSTSGIGSEKSGEKIRKITQNAIVKLLGAANLFSK